MRTLPIARVVCWFCKKGDVTLYRLRDANGKKTPDYACKTDLVLGLPEEPNQSLIPFPTKTEREQMETLLAERDSHEGRLTTN